jgi:hypothetical protein
MGASEHKMMAIKVEELHPKVLDEHTARKHRRQGAVWYFTE